MTTGIRPIFERRSVVEVNERHLDERDLGRRQELRSKGSIFAGKGGSRWNWGGEVGGSCGMPRPDHVMTIIQLKASVFSLEGLDQSKR